MAAAFAAATAGAAAAHEFTAAILVQGPDAETRLADAVNGFLLAADERDGHADETSDGHLGGLDVQVLPLPRAAAVEVRGLVGNPAPAPEIVVLLDPDADTDPAAAGFGPDVIVLRAGALPPRARWSDAGRADDFAARYRDAFGAAPSLAAARGYNAARRLDRAIRPLGGVAEREAIRESLFETSGGIDW